MGHANCGSLDAQNYALPIGDGCAFENYGNSLLAQRLV
jgi:hypothetical protein